MSPNIQAQRNDRVMPGRIAVVATWNNCLDP